MAQTNYFKIMALQKLFHVDGSLRLNFPLIAVVMAHSWLKDKNVNVVKYPGPLQVPLMIKFASPKIFELNLICQIS